MYNFDETKSLSELKELCFYIKAINESGYGSKWSDNIGRIINYLKKEYNLEVSASKLYLFVQKILYIVKADREFPSIKEIDSIISEYINYIRSEQKDRSAELLRAELNFEDPKFEVETNKFLSSKDLSAGVVHKEKLYTSIMLKLLVWSFLTGLFVVSSACCVIGIAFPKILGMFITKPQELAIIVLAFCVVFMLTYLVLYLCNRRNLRELGTAIRRYYKYEALIKLDTNILKAAKHNLFLADGLVRVNGIELSNEMMYSYLHDSDYVDISFYNKKISEDTKNQTELQYARLGQVISSREQDNMWREMDESRLEKQCMNREIVERINLLAETISGKNLGDEQIARSITELYCKDLSVDARNEKINSANSKIELAKNYIEMIDKLLHYESMGLFEKSQKSAKLKSVMTVSVEERLSFEKSLTAMLTRIEKANSLGLLTKGQAKSYKNVEKDLRDGIVQGLQLNSIAYRYDLANLYVKLYDELALFDVLN